MNMNEIPGKIKENAHGLLNTGLGAFGIAGAAGAATNYKSIGNLKGTIGNLKDRMKRLETRVDKLELRHPSSLSRKRRRSPSKANGGRRTRRRR